MAFSHLIILYGYPIVFLGAIFEGETILILGGFAVQEQLMSFPLLLFFAFLGAICGDFGWFLLGRFRGEKILTSWTWLQKTSTRPRDMISSRPKTVALFLRFMYGFRHVVPFSLGMSNIRTRTFLVLNAIGACLWVVAAGTAGYLFGSVMEAYLGRIRHYEVRIIIIAVLIVVFINAGMRLFKILARKSL
jgi:membrane protein DedA with SNARE-associated domain